MSMSADVPLARAPSASKGSRKRKFASDPEAQRLKEMRRVARAEISRQAENKEGTTGYNQQDLFHPKVFNGSTGTFFQQNNILDVSLGTVNNIAQGVGQANRIGNKIRLKKLVLRGQISVNAENLTAAASDACNVKMWIVSFKERPNDSNLPYAEAVTSSTFFQNGNSSLGMQGEPIDHFLAVNDDQVRLYKTRMYKIGTSLAPGSAGNNDYMLTRSFRIDLLPYMNKRLVYQDTSSQPRNKKLFVVFEPVKAVPGQALQGDTPLCSLTYAYEYEWEDM